LVDGVAREHSRKPEEAYRLIEELDFRLGSWTEELAASKSCPQHLQHRKFREPCGIHASCQ
jgi:hypothetical protein